MSMGDSAIRRVAKTAILMPKRRLSHAQAKTMAMAPNITDMKRMPKSVLPKMPDQIFSRK